ncbi:MAG: hypothetical protein RL662_1779 [Bacteroidota bacterium]|jgi:hypothetical protein
MPYTVVNGSTVYPTQVSYQLITLTDNIVLSWPSSFVGGPIAAGFNDVNPDQAGWTITLPDATLAATGTDVIFNNISIYTFNILKNDNTFLYTLNPGDIIDFKLYDVSTAAGLWRIIPFGGGYNGITAFEATSSDNSIDIINGSVVPPGAVIDFKLPESIFNLNNVITKGIPVIKSAAPLTWGTTTITAGTNINVTDGDGILAVPVINLLPDLSDLDSIQVGFFEVTGNDLQATDINTNLLFTTSGTGKLDFNGVLIDANGNTTISNLTVSGSFNNPFTPKAWCIFTDTIVGNSNSIVIEDHSNVTSISGSGGYYQIVFNTPMANINYGVMISLGSLGTTLPPIVYSGFWTTRNLSSVIISVVDASGELVTALPYGATVMIMSS